MQERKVKYKQLQTRIGPRTPKIIREWYDNQQSVHPNDGMRELLELIISLVGTEDIRSSKVYERIAYLKKNFNPPLFDESGSEKAKNDFLHEEIQSDQKEQVDMHKENQESHNLKRAARPSADDLDF